MATRPRRSTGTASASWRARAAQELEQEKKTLERERKVLENRIKDQEEDYQAYIPPEPWVYWFAIGTYLFAQCFIALSVWYFAGGLSWVSSPLEGVKISTGLTIWLLQIIHLAASFKDVKVDDLAGIDFYGRPIYLPKTGLYIVPFLLLTLTTASRNYADVRFPGPADKIFRISNKVQEERATGDMPDSETGQVRPIFVTTGEPRLSTKEVQERKKGDANPLDEQLNIEIAYFVRYRPFEEHGGIFRIIRNIGFVRGIGRGGNLDERIKDLIREQSERDIKSILTRQTYATIVENWALINEVFALKLQLSVMRLGIQIDRRGAGLDDINPSRSTNEEQAKVARARFARLQVITAADAEEQKRHREGRGTAKAYAEIKKKTGVEGHTVIASDTAKSFDKSRTTIFGAQGVKEVLSLIPGSEALFEKSPPASLAPPSSTPGTSKGGSS